VTRTDALPDDIETLKAMLLAERAEAKARALLIEQMKFTIAKLRHEGFGQSSERGTPSGTTRASARRHGRGCVRGRAQVPGGGSGKHEDQGGELRAQAAGASAIPRAPAA
jgi:hypothetical protein